LKSKASFHLAPEWQIEGFADLPSRDMQSSSGRGVCRLIDHPNGTILCRPYLHGGLRRCWFPRWFLQTKRPDKEWHVHKLAFEAGIPTSEPIGWREIPAPVAGFHFYAYYSRWIETAIPLPRYLLTTSLSRNQLDQIALILFQCLEHDIQHTDLNLNNWLVAGGRILLIDFDKAKPFRHQQARAWIITALRRMTRSAIKLGLTGPRHRRQLWRLIVFCAHRLQTGPHRLLEELDLQRYRVTRLRRLSWLIFGGHRSIAP